MFGPVQPTPYDLSFSLFGIPVRVTPWFWVAGVLLGFGVLSQFPEDGPLRLLIWLAVIFVSILVHEFGHASVAALFGYSPRIMLYQFGGMAYYDPTHGYSTAKAILITAAGPAFGFMLGIAAVVTAFVVGTGNMPPLLGFTIEEMIFVNIAWTVMNLMPVLPLDGGQICREVCLAASPRRGMTVALWISIIVAGLIAAGAFRIDRYVAIMFVILGIQNFQELQQRRAW